MSYITDTKIPQLEVLPLKTDIGALANRINAETRSHHNKVDKMVTFRFALALRDYKIYRQGLQSFYHVFASIETALARELEQNTPYAPMLAQVWKPEIARANKLTSDLLFFYDGHKEKFTKPIMPAQIAFANHILTVTREKPYLLFAYLHVMYLALFAGGRIIKSLLAKATGMFPKKDGLSHAEIVRLGTNLFHFDVASDEVLRVAYKRDYELVTRGGLSEDEKRDIIQESKYIFEQNAQCIMELEEHNRQRMQQKWQYVAVTKGMYPLLFMVLMGLVYCVRSVTFHWV